MMSFVLQATIFFADIRVQPYCWESRDVRKKDKQLIWGLHTSKRQNRGGTKPTLASPEQFPDTFLPRQGLYQFQGHPHFLLNNILTDLFGRGVGLQLWTVSATCACVSWQTCYPMSQRVERSRSVEAHLPSCLREAISLWWMGTTLSLRGPMSAVFISMFPNTHSHSLVFLERESSISDFISNFQKISIPNAINNEPKSP